jgi:hypothetical protein
MTCPTAATPSLKDRGIDVKDLVGQKVSAHIIVKEYQGKKRNYIGWYLDTPDCPLPKELAYLLLSEFAKWNKDNPCPADDGRYRWIFRAACAGRRCSLPPEWTEELIHKLLTRTARPGEVEQAVSDAYGKAYTTGGSSRPRVKERSFDPDKARVVAGRVPEVITWEWLVERSPVPVTGIPPSGVLDVLFNHGEHVPIKRRDNDYGFPYHVGDSKSAAKLNDYVKQNENGAWFYTCPTNGKYNIVRQEEKDGGVTYRQGACYADKLITHWRYLLLESDEKGFEQEWLKILVRLRQRIVALYTSGNVSVHALIRIDATSKEEFTKIADQYKRLVPFGACGGSLTALRATRLPGVIRGDNGREQRLLYLNPKADGSPIYKKRTP